MHSALPLISKMMGFWQYVICSLKVCMVKKYILNFVVTQRNFIIAKLSICKPGSSSVLIISVISTDEDSGLWIKSFAIIKLRSVGNNKI